MVADARKLPELTIDDFVDLEPAGSGRGKTSRRRRPEVPPPPRVNPRASGAPGSFSDKKIVGSANGSAERATCTGYRFAPPRWQNARPPAPEMKKTSKPGKPDKPLSSPAAQPNLDPADAGPRPAADVPAKAGPVAPMDAVEAMSSAVDDVLTRHGIFKGWERIAVPHGTVFCDLLLAHDDRLTGRPVLIEWIVELPAIVDDPQQSEARQIMLSECTAKLVELVKASSGGVLAGAVETPRRWRGIFFAETDQTPVKSAVRKALGDSFVEAGGLKKLAQRRGESHGPALVWKWHTKRRDNGKTYRKELYPNLHGQHEVLTRRVTASIGRDLPAEQLQIPRVVHHTLWMPTVKMARQAAVALGGDGFASDVKPRPGQPLEAKLLLSRPTLLTPDGLLPFVWNFCDLAQGVGGEYRGWGVYVGESPADDFGDDSTESDASAGD